MQSLLNQPEPETSAWPEIAPLLNVAMAELSEKHHSAIVLRFFEGKNLKQVGTALGVDERTAQTRVRRGVEKLRKFFFKRGITLSGEVIGGAISANAVQAAPVGLAKSATVVAIAKGAAASSSTLTLIKGALKIMAWTKMKTVAIVGVAVILAAGTTGVVIEHRRQAEKIISESSGTSSLPDLGVIDFTDRTPKYYSLGGDKSCTITGVTDSKGITLDIVFSATNADKTVRILGTPQIRMTSSRSSCMASAGNVVVRFTPKFKTP